MRRGTSAPPGRLRVPEDRQEADLHEVISLLADALLQPWWRKLGGTLIRALTGHRHGTEGQPP